MSTPSSVSTPPKSSISPLTSPHMSGPSTQRIKLDLREIFAQIGQRVCRVSTMRGNCSGSAFAIL